MQHFFFLSPFGRKDEAYFFFGQRKCEAYTTILYVDGPTVLFFFLVNDGPTVLSCDTAAFVRLWA